jgi:hypothetical protein
MSSTFDRSQVTARFAAKLYLAFGVLVVLAGVGVYVASKTGPRPSGCATMVQEVWALASLVVAGVVGVPHVVAPLWFLKRPERGRKLFLALVVVNLLVDAAYVVAFALAGPREGLEVWVPLLLINVVALAVLLRARRSARELAAHPDPAVDAA